jgi:hypothetical protein
LKKKKKKGAKYTNSGTVELMNIRIEKVYTFLDYVRGGYVICPFTVSILFNVETNFVKRMLQYKYTLNISHEMDKVLLLFFNYLRIINNSHLLNDVSRQHSVF